MLISMRGVDSFYVFDLITMQSDSILRTSYKMVQHYWCPRSFYRPASLIPFDWTAISTTAESAFQRYPDSFSQSVTSSMAFIPLIVLI
jgi:hypothetical protein